MDFQPALGVIRDTGTVKGRGAFATRDIAAGEVVEVCPVLILPGSGRDLPIDLRRVLYNWTTLAKTMESTAIALGYGSLYNHANPANLCYESLPDLPALRYTAARPIAAGEELTINYNASGGGIDSDDDCWFRIARVTPWAG